MDIEKVCEPVAGCSRCKTVVLVKDTVLESLVELSGEVPDEDKTVEEIVKDFLKGSAPKNVKAKMAKLFQYMKKLCSHGELLSPDQLNGEIEVKYKGHKWNTFAIKAKPLRAYGWIDKGVMYVSFFSVKKNTKDKSFRCKEAGKAH